MGDWFRGSKNCQLYWLTALAKARGKHNDYVLHWLARRLQLNPHSLFNGRGVAELGFLCYYAQIINMLDSVCSVIEGYCLCYSPTTLGAANTAAPIITHSADILENTIKWNAADGRRKLKSKWAHLPSHPSSMLDVYAHVHPNYSVHPLQHWRGGTGEK